MLNYKQGQHMRSVDGAVVHAGEDRAVSVRDVVAAEGVRPPGASGRPGLRFPRGSGEARPNSRAISARVSRDTRTRSTTDW